MSRRGRGRSGRGREGGRRGGRKRTGLNRAIGVIPVVAGARYLQRRKAEREDRERKSQSSQSQPRMSNPNNSKSKPIPISQGRPNKRPPRNTPRPITTNPLQGKPNVQQDVAITNSPLPTQSNNTKIALIVGGVLLLGIAAYFYSKRKK